MQIGLGISWGIFLNLGSEIKVMSMEFFRSEEDFWIAFEKFDALYAPGSWDRVHANKSHQDMFGVEIKVRDLYFRFQAGFVGGQGPKVSFSSMERLVFLTVEGSFFLADIGTQRSRIRTEALKKEQEDAVKVLDASHLARSA